MMIDIVRNPHGYSSQGQIYNAAAGAASMVKLVTGVCNNATYLVMVDAMERLAAHPRYTGRVRRLFTDAMKEWKRYEGNLLYATTNRFFHIQDMSEETRAKYGNISDREYMEFWQGCGGRAYMKTRPLITSLANKFRLSFERDGVPQADILQWALTADVCLHICVDMWRQSVKTASQSFGLPMDLCQQVFATLCVLRPQKAWHQAMNAMEPRVAQIMDEHHERNIALGISQLYEAWSSADGLFGSTGEAVSDFADVFSGRGTMRHALAELREMQRDVEQQQKEELRKKIMNQ